MKYINQIVSLIQVLSVCACSIVFAADNSELATENSSDAQLEIIRGLVKPTSTAVISSETSARIIKLPYKSGDAFEKGDELVKFDCGLYYAQLASAKASLEGKRKSHENLERLLALNATSDVEVELAEIEVKKSKADLSAASITVSRCSIKAPYDGRVINTVVNRYENISEGQELLSILNDKLLEIEVIVPSKWLVWMEKELVFEFHVDEIQKSYQAKVVQIGAIVDPVSQTVSIKGVFTEQVDVLAGMSGSARFNLTQ